MAKFWLGPIPSTCNVCSQSLVGSWIDGKTVGGSWANMCKGCHVDVGVGLGIGLGQEWSVETGEELVG